MENLGQKQNIVIRRIKKKKHGAHGGAWKVAMADFALAMMALFLVLWIINSSSQEQREAISGYFQDPLGYAEGSKVPSRHVVDMGGSPPGMAENIAESETVRPDQVLHAEEIESMAEAIERRRMESQLKQIQARIDASATLSPFKNQILLDITTEGVRLQIVDQTNRPMFDTGSARLKYYSEDILWELSPLLATMDNRLSISGHTDSSGSGQQFAEDEVNWRISALRADAARTALMEAGVPKRQVAQVIGMGDTAPLLVNEPDNPMNRRISITLLNKKSDSSVHQREGELDIEFINEQEEKDPRAEAIDRAQQKLQELEQQRQQEDNSYDNPPNADEAFW